MSIYTVLLADGEYERGDVVQDLVESCGHQVVRCSTVKECEQLLISSPHHFRFLLANAHLKDGPLIPLVEDACCEIAEPPPILLLWSKDGEFSLVEHQDFLCKRRAVVFRLPLDVDALLRVMHLLS